MASGKKGERAEYLPTTRTGEVHAVSRGTDQSARGARPSLPGLGSRVRIPFPAPVILTEVEGKVARDPVFLVSHQADRDSGLNADIP